VGGRIASLGRALADRVSRYRARTGDGVNRSSVAASSTCRTATTVVRPTGLHAAPLLPSSLVRRSAGAGRDACAGLEYQGIFNVNIGVDRPVLSDKHWVYFYEDEFPYHRLSFPGNFSPRNVPEGKSSVSTEVAYSRHRPLERETMLERHGGVAADARASSRARTRSSSSMPRRFLPRT
jgi:hypothetical protein